MNTDPMGVYDDWNRSTALERPAPAAPIVRSMTSDDWGRAPFADVTTGSHPALITALRASPWWLEQ